MSWKIPNEAINRKSKPQPKPNLFIKDNKIINGKTNSTSEFNQFFSSVGPKLAEKMGTTDKHFGISPHRNAKVYIPLPNNKQ